MSKRPFDQLIAKSPDAIKKASGALRVSEDQAINVANVLDLLTTAPSKDYLAYLIAALADAGEVSLQQLKKAMRALPPFSLATWDDIGGKYGVPKSYKHLAQRLDRYSLQLCYLPPSFHYALFQSGWNALDVYQDLYQQDREEARVRTLEPFLLAIMAIFRGRIINKPEHSMVATDLSSGGAVEHEIYVCGGSLFFVVELKLRVADKSAHVAQLFLELLSAAKENLEDEATAAKRVYGLLTDLDAYHFYSYDPATERFAFDCTMEVYGGREEKLARMVPVTNKIFSIILSGYMEMLVAKASLTDGRASPAELTKALELSNEAHQLFIKPPTSKENLEEQATAALGLLQQSITLVPRLQALQINIAEPTSRAELARVAEEHVDKFNPWTV